MNKQKKIRTEGEERRRGYVSKFEIAQVLRHAAEMIEKRPSNELIKVSLTFYYTREEYPR